MITDVLQKSAHMWSSLSLPCRRWETQSSIQDCWSSFVFQHVRKHALTAHLFFLLWLVLPTESYHSELPSKTTASTTFLWHTSAGLTATWGDWLMRGKPQPALIKCPNHNQCAPLCSMHSMFLWEFVWFCCVEKRKRRGSTLKAAAAHKNASPMLERLLSMQHLQLKCLEKSFSIIRSTRDEPPALPTLILDADACWLNCLEKKILQKNTRTAKTINDLKTRFNLIAATDTIHCEFLKKSRCDDLLVIPILHSCGTDLTTASSRTLSSEKRSTNAPAIYCGTWRYSYSERETHKTLSHCQFDETNLEDSEQIDDDQRTVNLCAHGYPCNSTHSRAKRQNITERVENQTKQRINTRFIMYVLEFTNYHWRTLKKSTSWKLCRITRPQEKNNWLLLYSAKKHNANSKTNNTKCAWTNKRYTQSDMEKFGRKAIFTLHRFFLRMG